jgi:hypothetical protein
MANILLADYREFLKISQAVGVGFLVMGAVGFIIKLSALHPFPVVWKLAWNNGIAC